MVYRQMELIRAETVEKMNVLLEGVNLVCITSDSWTASHQHFLSVVVHGISSDFKNHLVLPLPLAKLDLLGSGDIVEKVFESVSAALPGKRIAVATTDNGPNMIKWNERWKDRKMALCCSHVEQDNDKEHNGESA